MSFAAVAAGGATTVQPLFPARDSEVKDGKPAVSFSASEIQEGIKRHEHTLVIKFSAGRPTLDEIRFTLENYWNLAGRAAMGSWLDGRHVLVILQSDEDVRKVLASPMRMVKNIWFRIYRWSPQFSARREPLTTATWLRLPGVPMELFDPGFFEHMVSSFSKFIDVDARTKALSNPCFARVCVELDVSKPIPSAIWINMPDERSFWQPIVVEGKMKFCSKCRYHGHELDSCRKKVSALQNAGPNSRPRGEVSQHGTQHMKDNRNTKDKENFHNVRLAGDPSLPIDTCSPILSCISNPVEHKDQGNTKQVNDGTCTSADNTWKEVPRKQAIRVAPLGVQGLNKLKAQAGGSPRTDGRKSLSASNSFDILEAITEPVFLPIPLKGPHLPTPYEAQHQMILYEKNTTENAAPEQAENTSPTQNIKEDETVLGGIHGPVPRVVTDHRRKAVRSRGKHDKTREADSDLHEDKQSPQDRTKVQSLSTTAMGKNLKVPDGSSRMSSKTDRALHGGQVIMVPGVDTTSTPNRCQSTPNNQLPVSIFKRTHSLNNSLHPPGIRTPLGIHGLSKNQFKVQACVSPLTDGRIFLSGSDTFDILEAISDPLMLHRPVKGPHHPAQHQMISVSGHGESTANPILDKGLESGGVHEPVSGDVSIKGPESGQFHTEP